MISFSKIRRGKNKKNKRGTRVSGFSKSISKIEIGGKRKKKKKMYEWDTLMFRMVAV